jgi:outer membrane biosynthesis protein TonB
MRQLYCLFLVLALCFVEGRIASAQGAARETGMRDPVLLSLAPLRYLRKEASNRREGWVELEFTVKADGTVGDISVVDGFYTPGFES